MKQINNIQPRVWLSTYDDSKTLLPVAKDCMYMDNVCVAVKFGDTLIKISPSDTCECTWDEAMKKHRDKLMHPAFWQVIGAVKEDISNALEMLDHDPLKFCWSSAQCSSYYAWYYYGNYGIVRENLKFYSLTLRATLAFQF